MYKYLHVRVYTFDMSNIDKKSDLQSEQIMLLVIANRYDEPSGVARISGHCTLNVTIHPLVMKHPSALCRVHVCPVLHSRGSDFFYF